MELNSSLDSDPLECLPPSPVRSDSIMGPVPKATFPAAKPLRSILKHRDKQIAPNCASSLEVEAAESLPIPPAPSRAHHDWVNISKGSKYSPPPPHKDTSPTICNSFSPIAELPLLVEVHVANNAIDPMEGVHSVALFAEKEFVSNALVLGLDVSIPRVSKIEWLKDLKDLEGIESQSMVPMDSMVLDSVTGNQNVGGVSS